MRDLNALEIEQVYGAAGKGRVVKKKKKPARKGGSNSGASRSKGGSNSRGGSNS